MTLAIPKTKLDEHYLIRSVTMDDLESYFELFHIHMAEYHEESHTITIDDLRNDWQTPKFDLAQNTHAFFNSEGEMVGYAEIWDLKETPVRPWTWGYVHPDYRGQGIGTALFEWLEERGKQVFDRVPDDARVVLQGDTIIQDEVSKRLFEDMGWTTQRRSWNMIIDFEDDTLLETPEWPEGITITTLAQLNDMKAVYIAVDTAFKDHRGHIDESFETGFARWQHWIENDSKHDPTLWFLAMDGDKIAGISLCNQQAWDNPDKGYVNVLGVLRGYRRKGLATALLKHSFIELQRRGQKGAGLGVDATSLTGATRVYERVGMRVHKAYDLYEKELRAGRELSNQG